MKKILLTIILFIIPIFFTSTFADSIRVKVPLNLSKMWLACEAESTYYACTVNTWFASVSTSIWQIIKYFTFITGLAWVLYIIFNWIMLSMAWLDQNMEKQSKDNIKKALIWLILLLLSWAILNFIAPWIYQ